MLVFAPAPIVHIRPGTVTDLSGLLTLERAAFATDRLSRRSFCRFLASPNAALIVADDQGVVAGYALVLFRPTSMVARLYSIAVSAAGRGIGPVLLAAAEEAAHRRGCAAMRLEVHEHNAAALARYRKSGYGVFGRYRNYYEDGGDALRFEKPLALSSTGRKNSASPVPLVAR
jgi:ribosomal protein S18 acetylase RimI-like enzyme